MNKRPKYSLPIDQKWSIKSNEFPVHPSQYNPLDEPSPLGLRLRKSPSFLELIQMRLSHGNASFFGAGSTGKLNMREKKFVKGKTGSGASNKQKASNFFASLLRIGRWEYKSQNEGDLVAKCYFAKEKLVWEILDNGLKRKFEIQWSNITALKAICPDNGPGMLIVVLARRPVFYKEVDPQPRKHTQWQETTDFTDGEASLHRQHFLQCPKGLLNKHYEKWIQCGTHLKLLTQQPELVLDSPYFEARVSVYEGPDESKSHGFNQLETAKQSPISGLQDVASPSTPLSSSSKVEQCSLGITSEHSSQAPSPISVMDSHAIDGNVIFEGNGSEGPRNWEQLKVSGTQLPMSMGDRVNYIEHCISEKVANENPSFEKAFELPLEEIAEILLGDHDPELTIASDEKYFMSRANSFYRLLEDPVADSNLQINNESHFKGHNDEYEVFVGSNSVLEINTGGDFGALEGYNNKDFFGFNQPLAMSRKNSYGELHSNLPRIASLPRMFLGHL